MITFCLNIRYDTLKVKTLLKRIENENEIDSKTVNNASISNSLELNSKIDMIFNKNSNTLDTTHFKGINNK